MRTTDLLNLWWRCDIDSAPSNWWRNWNAKHVFAFGYAMYLHYILLYCLAYLSIFVRSWCVKSGKCNNNKIWWDTGMSGRSGKAKCTLQCLRYCQHYYCNYDGLLILLITDYICVYSPKREILLTILNRFLLTENFCPLYCIQSPSNVGRNFRKYKCSFDLLIY